jgi:hypothetical protein
MANFESVEGIKPVSTAELSREFSKILETERDVLEQQFGILKNDYGVDFGAQSIDRLFTADFFEILGPTKPGDPLDLEHEKWKHQQLEDLQKLHDDLVKAEDEAAKKIAALALLDHMLNV